jgi:GTP-binding protein
MALPTVAIIGRPNVGKSSLLNALAGQMISIVEPTAGVTRDRVTTLLERDGHYIELVDTGGYGIVDVGELTEHVEAQINKAVANASLIVFMVDIRQGVVPLDVKIAQLLRKQDIEVVPVANKADGAKMFSQAGEFNRLGFGDFLCISATNNLNKTVLLERIFEKVDHTYSEKPPIPVMKIAVVGKRNAGKSTLVNAIAGEDRVIVSEVAGTTRDAVDVTFEHNGRDFVVIDTAGVRKKKRMVNDSIEFYSNVRAVHSIKRSNLVLFMVDATDPIGQVDKKLAKQIMLDLKSCIIVVNKWDLAKERADTDDYAEYLTKALAGLKDVPIAFTTAKDGKNVQSLLDLCVEVYKQTTTLLPTAKLNKAFDIIKAERGVVKRGRKSPKVYYGTQVAVDPVTLLLFVNNPLLFSDQYRNFLISKLKAMLPIAEVPVRLLIRARRQNKV